MTEKNMGLLWHSFLYEVNRATASLMYLLQGMESVRDSELSPYNELPPDRQRFAPCCARLSNVDVLLCLSGIRFDLNDILKLGGEAEQLAFKGWVEQVYNVIWESRYRNEMRDILEGPDTFRPETDPIGDFRLIRDDLIHNGGVASEQKTGKCVVLKWFEPGDRIILGMCHVFDFLNHMAFMTSTPGFLGDGPAAMWTVFPGMEDAIRNRSVPGLVSITSSMDKQLEDGSSYHVVSVVFENGVFVEIPVVYPPDGSSVEERIRFFDKTMIDEDGNLHFANERVKDRGSLYREAVDALFKKGPKIEGINTGGPWFRFRK